MSSLRLSCKTLVMLTLFTSSFAPLIVADNIHSVEKRQIGVLARTGALPQGKRSVEVLARNGELPQGATRKDTSDEDTEDVLIDELEKAEALSKLRAQALADKLLRNTAKRSVAALARNGELPQKRLSEPLSRSGYLIKPSQETAQSSVDLLDPDDFLADAQSPVNGEFGDERSFRTFASTAKRSLGSARNFLLDSGTDWLDKRNVGTLARDGGYPLTKDRRLREWAFDWADLHDDDKKSVATYAGSLANCCDQYPYQLTKSVDKADATRRMTDYEDEGNPLLEKRFLGRIPQLGRIHQKVQSPSSRRRPHLRPNWL